MARKVLKAMLKEQTVLLVRQNKKTKTVNYEKLLRKYRTIIVNLF
jgi:hypothetical protein